MTTTTKTYLVTSVKGERVVRGTLEEAIKAARRLDEDLQPIYGVEVWDAARDVLLATIDDGQVTMEEDDDPAAAVRDAEEDLCTEADHG